MRHFSTGVSDKKERSASQGPWTHNFQYVLMNSPGFPQIHKATSIVCSKFDLYLSVVVGLSSIQTLRRNTVRLIKVDKFYFRYEKNKRSEHVHVHSVVK